MEELEVEGVEEAGEERRALEEEAKVRRILESCSRVYCTRFSSREVRRRKLEVTGRQFILFHRQSCSNLGSLSKSLTRKLAGERISQKNSIAHRH